MSNYNAVCTYHSKLESEVFVDFLEGMRKGSVIVDETTVCDVKKAHFMCACVRLCVYVSG